ncbi:MAG: serine protease, partial [Planctomycetota bacterium]
MQPSTLMLGQYTVSGFVIHNESSTVAIIASRADAFSDLDQLTGSGLDAILFAGTAKQLTLAATPIAYDSAQAFVFFRIDGTAQEVELPSALTPAEEPVEILDLVTSCGHPLRSAPGAKVLPNPTVSSGRVSSLRSGVLDTPEFIQVDRDFSSGIEGAPVVNADGRLVGMVARRIGARVGLVTPIARILAAQQGRVGGLLIKKLSHHNGLTYELEGFVSDPFKRLSSLRVELVGRDAYAASLREKPKEWPVGQSKKTTAVDIDDDGQIRFEIKLEPSLAKENWLLQVFSRDGSEPLGAPWPLPKKTGIASDELDILRYPFDLGPDQTERSAMSPKGTSPIPRPNDLPEKREPSKEQESTPVAGDVILTKLHDRSMSTRSFQVNERKIRKIFLPARLRYETADGVKWSADGKYLFLLLDPGVILRLDYPSCGSPCVLSVGSTKIERFETGETWLRIHTAKHQISSDLDGTITLVVDKDYSRPFQRYERISIMKSGFEHSIEKEVFSRPSGKQATRISVVNRKGEQVKEALEIDGFVYSADFEEDAEHILLASSIGLLSWDRNTAALNEVTLLGGRCPVRLIAQHPNKRCFA